MAGRKTLLAPIHFIFSLLQKRETVSIWLYEQLAFRLEGRIKVSWNPLKAGSSTNFYAQGFDEFMNLVIDDAVEVRLATKNAEEARRPLGMCLDLLDQLIKC